MLIRSYTHKEIQEILDDKYQSKLALSFTLKYLYEIFRRNKKFLRQMKESEELKNQKIIDISKDPI